MADLTHISRIPNVASAVLGDLSGGFFDAVREADGEAVAAVAGFLSTNLAEAGDRLGLGPLGRISLSGERRATVILLRGGSVVAASVDPAAALTAVERALDGSRG